MWNYTKKIWYQPVARELLKVKEKSMIFHSIIHVESFKVHECCFANSYCIYFTVVTLRHNKLSLLCIFSLDLLANIYSNNFSDILNSMQVFSTFFTFTFMSLFFGKKIKQIICNNIKNEEYRYDMYSVSGRIINLYDKI